MEMVIVIYFPIGNEITQENLDQLKLANPNESFICIGDRSITEAKVEVFFNPYFKK